MERIDIVFQMGRSMLCSSEQNLKQLFSVPFLEILEESVLFDENKQVLVQDVADDSWTMTMTFLLLFLISLVYGVSVTLLKVSQTDVADIEMCDILFQRENVPQILQTVIFNLSDKVILSWILVDPVMWSRGCAEEPFPLEPLITDVWW